MRRPIMKNEAFLRRASEPATQDDLPVGDDLRDTLEAHAHECVGMAANMIGVSRRVIVFADELIGRNMVMFNPEIVDKAEPYAASEGCLSLTGERNTTRYRRITVTYRDRRWRERTARFEDFTAQIIQHEVDHCNGVII
ncbi:peptide deformylase [Bifidobacterium primatium]|uniref:Peptide deformylase n=2 Tax=Bifidobacterium TaxID=1678 RepID=A0A2M9H8I0_9BIFI|nr:MULTISPECIES: peptide deformylase [Bifidobacterium]NEG96088.1 peptide deformylase [Bifidobacterium sp. SMB2]NEH10834.1 peptide deformylase [Bifidobacterium saimiriisciurei]PJM73112.1 peptide deformylase [Bifidobacterium primatium]